MRGQCARTVLLLDEGLEVVVHLGAHAHGLLEGGGAAVQQIGRVLAGGGGQEERGERRGLRDAGWLLDGPLIGCSNHSSSNHQNSCQTPPPRRTPPTVDGPAAHPVGRIMNSCMARPLPACSPPLMTLKLGTGSTWWIGCGGGGRSGVGGEGRVAAGIEEMPRAGRSCGLSCFVCPHTPQRCPTCALEPIRAPKSAPPTHQLGVAGQLSDVLVQGQALLSGAGLGGGGQGEGGR